MSASKWLYHKSIKMSILNPFGVATKRSGYTDLTSIYSTESDIFSQKASAIRDTRGIQFRRIPSETKGCGWKSVGLTQLANNRKKIRVTEKKNSRVKSISLAIAAFIRLLSHRSVIKRNRIDSGFGHTHDPLERLGIAVNPSRPAIGPPIFFYLSVPPSRPFNHAPLHPSRFFVTFSHANPADVTIAGNLGHSFNGSTRARSLAKRIELESTPGGFVSFLSIAFDGRVAVT